MITFKNPTPIGYSQRVAIDLGPATMLILSGQVPLDEQGNTVGRGDFARQAEQVFSHIQQIVADEGGTMSHVVKLTAYLVDITQLPTFRLVRDRFVNRQHPPASTAVGVSALFREDVMVEIEATAVIPK